MSVVEDVERTVAETIERFDRIDILVTCAGSSPGGLLENLTEDDWFSSLNLKFMGYVRTCRAVVPHMRTAGGGSIVLVVGNDGLKPSYWEMTAGVANAADINFASSLAEQYGPLGIRVNTVNPGPVEHRPVGRAREGVRARQGDRPGRGARARGRQPAARSDLRTGRGREPRRVPRLPARELPERRAHPDGRRTTQGADGPLGQRTISPPARSTCAIARSPSPCWRSTARIASKRTRTRKPSLIPSRAVEFTQ